MVWNKTVDEGNHPILVDVLCLQHPSIFALNVSWIPTTNRLELFCGGFSDFVLTRMVVSNHIHFALHRVSGFGVVSQHVVRPKSVWCGGRAFFPVFLCRPWPAQRVVRRRKESLPLHDALHDRTLAETFFL